MTRHTYKVYMAERKFVIRFNRKLARLGYPLMKVPLKIKAPKTIRKIGWLDYYTDIKSNGRQKINEGVC